MFVEARRSGVPPPKTHGTDSQPATLPPAGSATCTFRGAFPGRTLAKSQRGTTHRRAGTLKAQAEWAARWNRVRCRACSELSRATYVDVHGTWCPPHPAHAPANAAPPIRLWCRHSSHRVLITILPPRSRSDDPHAFRHTFLHTTPPVGHLTHSRLQLCIRRRQGYFQYLSGASAHEGTAGGGALFKSTAPCLPIRRRPPCARRCLESKAAPCLPSVSMDGHATRARRPKTVVARRGAASETP